MCTFVLELQHVLVHQFEKEHRPTVLFNAKSKSTEYAEKIIKVLKAFVDITVNFPIQGLHCTYINTSVVFITEHKSSLCKVGGQLIEVRECMHNIIYWWKQKVGVLVHTFIAGFVLGDSVTRDKYSTEV